MDTGSFYRGGVNLTSPFGHEANFTPPMTPHVQSYAPSTHGPSQDSLVGMNHKLDKMLSLFMEQRSAIERGQVETAEIRKQMDTFSSRLSEIKSCVDDLQQNTNATGRSGKKRVPKDLSVCWTIGVCLNLFSFWFV